MTVIEKLVLKQSRTNLYSPVLSESCIIVSLLIEILRDLRSVPANILSGLCRSTLPVTKEGST